MGTTRPTVTGPTDTHSARTAITTDTTASTTPTTPATTTAARREMPMPSRRPMPLRIPGCCTEDTTATTSATEATMVTATITPCPITCRAAGTTSGPRCRAMGDSDGKQGIGGGMVQSYTRLSAMING